METSDLLSSLFSDPEKLQNAISMASSMLGGQSSAPAEPPPAAESAPPPVATDAPHARPSINPSYDPSAELMNKAMPLISAIARSGQTAVTREKANLLNSLKPFVSGGVSTQLDHAMRLVSMARMARSAMTELGNAAHNDGDDGTRTL
ncbi:MAG: hypothetical protein EOM63_02775 [Clostridia bacterium]|nr:hypothetical protein [Clostridia bacterium]